VSDVLITGGNGFVGRHLVTALQERGDTARVLALPGEDTAWLERRGVAVHRGDVRQPATLGAPMRGADGVVHLAAMMDVWRPLPDYRAVNVAGTVNVCRAARAAGAQRIVHMSSSSVYGMGLGRPADETFALRPFADPYPVSKAEGDRAVQQLIAGEHLPAVVMRPDQIFGPGDHLHFGQMADRLARGRSIIVGSGRKLMPFVFVSDVIQALLLGLDHPTAAGRTYNISSDRPLTQLEFLSAIAHDIGAGAPRVHVPYRLLYAAGYAAERAAALRGPGSRPPITRLGVAFFGTHNRYAIERAQRELGYAPRVPVREGVRLTAAWYRSAREPEPDAVASRPPQPATQ